LPYTTLFRSRDERGHPDRPPGAVSVPGALEERPEVVEREGVDDLGGELVRLPERGEQEDEERAEVDEEEPGERRREEPADAQARMAEEERREPPAGADPARRLSIRD